MLESVPAPCEPRGQFVSPLSPALCCWPMFTGLLWLPAPQLPVPESPQPFSPGSPCRLEKELETLENSSSVASTKENLAEAAAKEEKAEAVPNAQKVGMAAGHGQGCQQWGGGPWPWWGWVGVWVVGVQAAGLWWVLEASITSPFCFAESPGPS